MWRKLTVVFIVIIYHVKVKSQFHECHNDPEDSPENGPIGEPRFAWLGALQYIHVKNGTPHYFRVPRVVLISRQFVLSTAVDAAEIPPGYALGNVAFSDYDRDEIECGLTAYMVSEGKDCDPAILLIPIADVLLHPEYKHFNAKNSLALLKLVKPIKSLYMLPACLPFKNYLINARGKMTKEKILHIDYVVDVPRDFSEEEKEVRRVSLLPRELCYKFDPEAPENSARITLNRMMCTTGCGFHSGAPTLVHEHTGHWSLVALATGGTPCPDPLRPRRPPAPPQHVMIYPYVSWITAAITGKPLGAFAKDDPFGFVMPRHSNQEPQLGHFWLGHWYMGGYRCFDRGLAADDMFIFYKEIFLVKPVFGILSYITYSLDIMGEPGSLIVCVKVGMPYRLTNPRVYDVMKGAVQVVVPVIATRNTVRFQVEAWGYNTSSSSSSSMGNDSYYKDDE